MNIHALEKNQENTSCELVGRPNILLIEDDETLQLAHSMFLSMAKYNFKVAPTGADAISKFYNNHFDLVLLDINLPDMSGIDVNKEIRKSYYGKKVPIVALTSHGKAIEPECLSAGVTAVFAKPLKYPQFESVLQSYLN